MTNHVTDSSTRVNRALRNLDPELSVGSKKLFNARESINHRSERLGRHRVHGVVVILVLILFIGACSGSDSAQTSVKSTSATSSEVAAPITDSGKGEVQSVNRQPPQDGKHGSRTLPLDWYYLSAFSTLNSSIIVRFSNIDICELVGRDPGRRNEYNGVTSYVTLIYYRFEDGGPVKSGVLACSDFPSTQIWPYTAGPGPEGISVACPGWAPNALRSTGQAFRPENSAVLLTQAAGGYGSANDGLWNFKFFNWSNQDELAPSIWLICE